LRDRLQAEQAEQDERGGPPAVPAPAPRREPQPTQPAQAGSDRTRWVSADEMKTLFPDLF
jgi:hypothetical protein